MSRQSPYAPEVGAKVLVRGPVFFGAERACTVTAVLSDDVINVADAEGRDLLGVEYDSAQTQIPYAYWRHDAASGDAAAAEQPAAADNSEGGPQAPPADPAVAGSAEGAAQ